MVTKTSATEVTEVIERLVGVWGVVAVPAVFSDWLKRVSVNSVAKKDGS